MLVDPKFDAREAAIVIGADVSSKTGLPTLDASAANFAAAATIVSDRVNQVGIEVNTPQPAMRS